MIELLLSTALHVYIYDGDNIRVEAPGVSRETFRLADLDAPEIKGKCEAERRLALIARNTLRKLAADPSARLVEVPCHGANFGRKCAILQVQNQSVSGMLIAAQLVDPYICTAKGCPPRRQWCDRN